VATRIDDPADPRIEAYLGVRERDLVGRSGHFVAEGEVVLRALLSTASRCSVASLLIAENRLAKLSPLVATLNPATPVYTASQTVMDAIVGFPIHRGVLALGIRPPNPALASLLAGLPARSLVLGLFGIGNHDNMGGLFRNAAAFGVDAVLLEHSCCDPLYRKSIRVSVGAALTVPFANLAEGEDMLDRLGEAGFTSLAFTPAGGESVKGLQRPARAAVLMGGEGPGLPRAVLERARTVVIPMAPAWDSLNVAAASAIALHALA
jgi:tRNA G18 (ribose-2'-O)-methylase SpoU